MNLLAGTPIKVDEYYVRPWTLGEINEFGESRYNLFASYLLVTKDSLKKDGNINQELLSKLDNYQMFCGLLLSNEREKEIVLRGLSHTLGLNFFMDKLNGLYYFDSDKKIEIFDDSLFDTIRSIFSVQNYLSDSESSGFNPANSKAKELFEKRQKAREKIREKNKEGKDGLNLSDTISIVACYAEGINLKTIWDLTVYQLYETYVRLQLWDDFHITQSLSPYLDKDAMKNSKHWGIKVSPNTIKEENK